MNTYVESRGEGGVTGADWDDAASASGLMVHFARGFACGALDEEDLAAAGLSPGPTT